MLKIVATALVLSQLGSALPQNNQYRGNNQNQVNQGQNCQIDSNCNNQNLVCRNGRCQQKEPDFGDNEQSLQCKVVSEGLIKVKVKDCCANKNECGGDIRKYTSVTCSEYSNDRGPVKRSKVIKTSDCTPVSVANQGNKGNNQLQGNNQNQGYNPNQVNNQNQGYNPNQGNNQNQGYNPNQGNNQNQGYNPNVGNNHNKGYNPNQGNNQNQGYNPNLGNNQNQGYNQYQGNNQDQGNNQYQGDQGQNCQTDLNCNNQNLVCRNGGCVPRSGTGDRMMQDSYEGNSRDMNDNRGRNDISDNEQLFECKVGVDNVTVRAKDCCDKNNECGGDIKRHTSVTCKEWSNNGRGISKANSRTPGKLIKTSDCKPAINKKRLKRSVV